MKAGKPLLELNGVSKDYGDVGVLRDVNLRLEAAKQSDRAGRPDQQEHAAEHHRNS
jgi:hypothetical protein